MNRMEPTHEEIKELLPVYALGAVPDDEAAAIRSHILGCEECMQEADRLTVTADGLALVGGLEPVPAGFADRVMAAALEGREVAVEPEPRARRRWTFAAAAAVAASLAVAGVMTFQVVELRREEQRKEQVLAVLSR